MLGQICHHFGWTIEYTLKVPDWRIIQRMLIDTPRYESEDKLSKNKEIDLTEQSADDIIQMMSKFK